MGLSIQASCCKFICACLCLFFFVSFDFGATLRARKPSREASQICFQSQLQRFRDWILNELNMIKPHFRIFSANWMRLDLTIMWSNEITFYQESVTSVDSRWWSSLLAWSCDGWQTVQKLGLEMPNAGLDSSTKSFSLSEKLPFSGLGQRDYLRQYHQGWPLHYLLEHEKIWYILTHRWECQMTCKAVVDGLNWTRGFLSFLSAILPLYTNLLSFEGETVWGGLSERVKRAGEALEGLWL